MSKDIVVKKGLDLRLIGAPSLEIEEAKFSKDYSVYPADFHGVYPKLIVKGNDSVKAGEALFYDKNSERVKFVSPVSGKIVILKSFKTHVKTRFLVKVHLFVPEQICSKINSDLTVDLRMNR